MINRWLSYAIKSLSRIILEIVDAVYENRVFPKVSMMTNEFFNYLIATLLDNANDSLEDCKRNHDDFNAGRLMAYDENYNPNSIGKICESIINKIPK